MAGTKHSASFRDPSGFIFKDGGRLLRQVNKYYQREYDQLMKGGLYDELVDKGWLVKHKEISSKPTDPQAYKVIQPELIDFITYPYEWSFSQLKDAALLTLQIQQLAMKYQMSLKDASAYNIQFRRGQPVLIDTLSFEILDKPKPWVAYKQYCQHFLAPLSLMAYVDLNLLQLLRTNIDGIPLDLAARLLPAKTRFKFGLGVHLHTHARLQKRHAGSAKASIKTKTISQNALTGIIASLQNATKKLQRARHRTEWGDYYTFTNYNDAAFANKRKIIEKFLDKCQPKSVWDLGANNGLFSRIASDRQINTIAFDIDPAAVEANYHQVKQNHEQYMLPALMDLTNPSPALGWAHRERDSLEQRGPAHTIMALALVHHLAISNNLPLQTIADYFSRLGQYLIIEFVPKGDSQVDKLLATRQDIFPDYTESGFEAAFGQIYKIIDKQKLKDSHRSLYLMKVK